MLELTRQRMLKAGFTNFVLKEADSRSLPFEDNQFDLLYNGYMLDLIPEYDMPQILSEFKRVLKPGGRLVLLNMSKPDERPILRELLYQRLPAKLVLYLMGSCRPVLMENPTKSAGFIDVKRTYLAGKAPSEIVLGSKPVN
jgi:demethylmenaquinone methyltransferase/2-methoxy-6-polyprenyl-1,4-benzoquinol methylase